MQMAKAKNMEMSRRREGEVMGVLWVV